MLTLKYADSNLAMVVVLPETAESFEPLLLNLPLYQSHILNARFHEEEVSLTMPKFKLETKSDLESALKALGLVNVFTQGGDFSGIIDLGEPLYIGKFEHVVAIEVNENGTEAAAATSKLFTC